MIEDRAGENEAIRKCHRDADGNSVACCAQHAAGGGAVEINRVADARKQRGNDVRLAIYGESDVAHVTFVEDLVNGFAVVGAAMRFTYYARTLAWRNGFGHVTPH